MLFGLFGCNKYELIYAGISRKFVKNKKGEFFYKSVSSSSWRVDYFPISTQHPKSFKPLSEVYAKDKYAAYFKWHPLPKADAANFRVDKDDPNLLSTDGQSVFYERHLLENFIADDFKAHSRNYISNSEKVLLVNKNQFKGLEYSQYEVPVSDIKSFSIVETKEGKKEHTLGGLAKDKNWLYVNNVRLPIPSHNASVLSGGFPATIVAEDKLFLLFGSERQADFLFKKLPKNLSFIDYGNIAKFEYHDYYLFHIEGFEELHVLSEKWLKDTLSLYFVEREKIFLASSNVLKNYKVHPDYPHVISHEDGVIAYYFINHESPLIHHFSAEAIFLTGDVIKDQGKVYQRGKQLPNVDYESLVLVGDNHLMDKNYYYYSSFNSPGQVLPDGAYEKLKNGEAIWQDFFGVKMNAEMTVYQDYWGGFAITHQLPKNWREEAFVLQLVQQVGHPTRLEQALEKQLKFYFKVQSNDEAKQEYIAFEPELTLIDNYDYNNIQPQQQIKIEYRLTEDQIQQVASSLPEGAVSTYIGILITRGGAERATPDELYLEGSLLVSDINNENY
jgi:hypothetical protein